MRIVGGRFKGRGLSGPSSPGIRPTSDRLRETIFNILEHAHGDPVPGARVIDLFAGTGALALEALSRGAVFAMLVDSGAEARALLRANIEALGLAGVTRIFRRDAGKLGDAPPGRPFGLAFLDPPYGQDLAGPALASLGGGGWLAPDAICVVEDAEGAPFTMPHRFDQRDRRVQGETEVRILRYRASGL